MFNNPAGEDNSFDPVLFAAWVDALKPVAPPAGLEEKIMSRIRGAAAPAVLRTVRADQGWVEFVPGIEIKMLYRDEAGQAKSFLARLQPGVTLPPHEHDLAEECLVLEGEIMLGDVTVRAGDYHFAPQGAKHGTLFTRTGALLFLRGGLNQHVPEPQRL